MIQYLVRRLLQFIPVVIAITFVAFCIFYFTPGDPASLMAGEGASQAAIDAIRARLGLDQPFHVQYGMFMSRLVRGDLGVSYRSRMPVTVHLIPAMVRTLQLALVGLVVASAIGISAGVYSATHRYTLSDYVVTSGALAGVSAPLFWTGSLLILLFAHYLGWFPTGGTRAGFRSLVLPGFTIGIHYGAIMARMTRTCMLEVLGMEYISTARAKGLSMRVVYYKHALRNAAIPILTTMGLQLGTMLGGTFVTEVIFSWPGIGRMIVNGIFERDAPVVQGGIIFVALAFSTINLIVDLTYAKLDPTVRTQGGSK